MTVEEITELIKQGLAWAAAVGIVVDLTPGIKVQPVRYLIRQIGNLINYDIKEKLEKIEKDLQDHKVDSWRCEILDFANSCMNHRKHTKEEFDHVIGTCDKYGKYIEEHDLSNGQVDVAEEYIKELYKERMKNNDFLVVHDGGEGE